MNSYRRYTGRFEAVDKDGNVILSDEKRYRLVSKIRDYFQSLINEDVDRMNFVLKTSCIVSLRNHVHFVIDTDEDGSFRLLKYHDTTGNFYTILKRLSIREKPL